MSDTYIFNLLEKDIPQKILEIVANKIDCDSIFETISVSDSVICVAIKGTKADPNVVKWGGHFTLTRSGHVLTMTFNGGNRRLTIRYVLSILTALGVKYIYEQCND